jgi:hypothetical protein
VFRYPDFVEVVVDPWNNDDGAVAADPSNPLRISFFSMQARWLARAWDVCLGARHSTNIHFVVEGEPSFVFSMKAISGFFTQTTGHRASVIS